MLRPRFRGEKKHFSLQGQEMGIVVAAHCLPMQIIAFAARTPKYSSVSLGTVNKASASRKTRAWYRMGQRQRDKRKAEQAASPQAS